MITEEITEFNFQEKVEEGIKRVEEKIRHLKAQEEKKEINWYSFFDPTVWAYKFLKDEQGNPLVLRGFQDKIINDKSDVIVVAAANQLGKTMTAVVKVLHHAIHVPNASVLVVSRSEQQAIYILDGIRWMMRRAGISFDTIIDEVENRTEFHITNHDKKGVSAIRCLPPTNRVLAYPATLIICDEIGFWEIENMKQTEYFNKVIRSRIQETREWKVNYKGVDLNNFFKFGQIFCISSTNAQQGILWHLWNIPSHTQYRYCWLAKQGRTLEEYNQIKPTMSSDEFDSVFGASFSSAFGGFILQSELNDAIKDYSVFPPPEEMISLGGDFAGEDTTTRDVDETVLIGGQKIKEEKIEKVKIVYYNGFPLRVKKQEVYDEIVRLKYINNFAYDKGGVGDSIKNDLIDQKILSEYQIESLTYSLPNKSEVYYNMKRLFEQRKIIIPDLPKLKEQLLGLRFEKTEGGHIKVHHASEGLHDDWADALANCCWATMRSSAIPVDLTIIKREPEKKELTNKGTLTFCDKCDNYFYSNREHECLTI